MRASAALLLLATFAAAAPAAAGEPDAVAIRVRPRGGVAYHPQLARPGVAAGASAGVSIAGGRFAFGLAVERLRFTYGRNNVAVGSARANLEATLETTPVLLEAEVRFPIAGTLFGFAGAGGGVAFTRVETRATGGTAHLPVTAGEAVDPAGVGFAGLGVGLGPGRVTLEGRFHAVSGEVEGAAKGVSAGGLSGQAGYELAF